MPDTSTENLRNLSNDELQAQFKALLDEAHRRVDESGLLPSHAKHLLDIAHKALWQFERVAHENGELAARSGGDGTKD